MDVVVSSLQARVTSLFGCFSSGIRFVSVTEVLLCGIPEPNVI